MNQCVCLFYRIAPPEAFEQPAVISKKFDIWSIGVLLYYWNFNEYPFNQQSSEKEILENSLGAKKFLIFKTSPNLTKPTNEYEKTLFFLIKLCLFIDLDSRGSIKDILQHEFYCQLNQN